MLVEASDLAPAQELLCDVCIVGGGPAGLTTARRLAAAGVRVLVLERGRAEPGPGGSSLTTATSVGLRYPLRESRAAGLGGSSLRWDIATPLGAPFVRLHEFEELDFERREGVSHSGWPYGKSVLAPHYRRAWELFGLRPPQPAAPVEGPVQRDAFVFGPAATFTRHLPLELRDHPNAVVVTGATASDVRSDHAADRISSLVCHADSGAHFSVTAAVYVLAAGGIENPRLLLTSTSGQPNGLGNGHDLVGRYFQEHPHYDTGLLLSRRLNDAWRHHVRQGQSELDRFSLVPHRNRPEGLLTAAVYLLKRARSAPFVQRRDRSVDVRATAAASNLRKRLLGKPHSGLLARDLGSLAAAGPAVARVIARELAVETALRRGGHPERVHGYTLQVTAEQEPLWSSRVRLGAGVDRHGVPLAELDWRLSPLTHSSMLRLHDLLTPALAHVFDGTVHGLLDPDRLPTIGVGYHHQGTTRMHASPRVGVVDPDCRVHGVQNLYVAGSSVFPTGGAANPTLTIVALADRLGEHLLRQIVSRRLDSARPRNRHHDRPGTLGATGARDRRSEGAVT